MQTLAAAPADACDGPFGAKGQGLIETESDLFDKAAGSVLQELNAAIASSRPPSERATESLRRLEQVSLATNASWPDENRFHFEVLDIAPALVVQMSFRTHGHFFVFGLPQDDSGKPSGLWRDLGRDDMVFDVPLHSGVALYPLHRGPRGNPRFLAVIGGVGCAGYSSGITYEVGEWDQQGFGLKKVVKQNAATALEPEVPGFPWIGKFETDGPLLTLPYCVFSGIDTWDNPRICMVDTYDLSGDDVQFVSRDYNRPDLVPIAKVLEYAAEHEYYAMLAYCISPDIAQQLVRDLPNRIFASQLVVTQIGSGRERVEMGLYLRFEVEQISGRWQVVSFSENQPDQ